MVCWLDSLKSVVEGLCLVCESANTVLYFRRLSKHTKSSSESDWCIRWNGFQSSGWW